MKITVLICITAILIVFIHDVTGPLILLEAELDLAHQIERIQKNKPSIEIIPSPWLKVEPELRKEKL